MSHDTPVTHRNDAPTHDLVLTVNGEARSVPPQCSVRGLLALLELDGKRIAVAVNRDVVPRSEFPTRLLEGGDRIEILEAAGGG